MIPEVGHIILVTHLILSFLGGTLPLISIFTGYKSFEFQTKKLSLLLLLLITFSFLTLVYSFSIDDFSVAYVAANSNINLPFYYKLAATWGAHEGSLLLWILAMNILIIKNY